MPTISDLRAIGSIDVVSYPVYDPLNAPAKFTERLGRFGEHYNLTPNSHLYRYLLTLCGDAGVGGVAKELMYQRLHDQVMGTNFLDLDRLYGESLALPRISSEFYSIDPNNEMMTQEQWAEVRIKDAQYRARGLLWMKAIIEGGTPLGMKLAAEAATGVPCDIFEQYQEIGAPAYQFGKTNSWNEFVVIPRAPDITQEEQRRIVKLLDRIKPVNTLVTIADGDYLSTEHPVIDIDATSSRFNLIRLVTGQPEIDWPPLNLAAGYWVETEEKEVPFYAFLDRQEAATYLTITGVEASSVHVGPFNKYQSELFPHLRNTPANVFFYHANHSFADVIAPLSFSTPITSTTSVTRETVLINNAYPLGYFTEENLNLFPSQPVEHFWASTEELAPTPEYLIFELGRIRPVNFIDFEVSQKPIDVLIEYDNAGVWTEITPRTDFISEHPAFPNITYLPNGENSWIYAEYWFELVETSKIRITFTRQEERFPLPSSPLFPWSVEVRNARIMHIIPFADEYLPDTGTDILGNSYSTDFHIREPFYVLDEDPNTYWESQPNPSPSAVEALYFDLRVGDDGVVVDEIFIDPVTYGVDMHVYYSNETDVPFDDMMWIPIPQSYVVHRGFHPLPLPTYCKYIKLEFSNLAPIPYQPIVYPQMPPVRFNRYPSWVQSYFAMAYPTQPFSNDIAIYDTIIIDPLIFGWQQLQDERTVSFEDIRARQLEGTENEVKVYIEEIQSGKQRDTQDPIEATIEFRPPIMWQDDLVANIDSNYSLARFILRPREDNVETLWNAELGLPINDPPVVQSVSDLTTAYKEKVRPRMFFPRACRHGYQVVEAPHDKSVAYIVSLRTVSFQRRDHTIKFDDKIINETLDDIAHTEINEFVRDDWRYVASGSVV